MDTTCYPSPPLLPAGYHSRVKQKTSNSWAQWLKPVILATQEAEVRRKHKALSSNPSTKKKEKKKKNQQ
jgi:hypothetical protein